MSIMAKLIGTLTFAGLVSGLAIVGIYQLTLPRITANKAAALQRAVFQVLPGSSQLEPMVWRDAKLITVEAPAKGEQAIYAAYDSVGAFVGFAIPGEGAGFQDVIQLIYGFKTVDRKIVGMQVLDSRETPGLGDKILKDENFLSEFHNLAVEPEVVAVKGHGENPNDVDAITGATISSKAIVKIINATNAIWLQRLPAPGQEPPPPPGSGSAEAAPGTRQGE
jgi:electron transport complex protein RnfG